MTHKVSDLDGWIEGDLLYTAAVLSDQVRSSFTELHSMTTHQAHQPVTATLSGSVHTVSGPVHTTPFHNNVSNTSCSVHTLSLHNNISSIRYHQQHTQAQFILSHVQSTLHHFRQLQRYRVHHSSLTSAMYTADAMDGRMVRILWHFKHTIISYIIREIVQSLLVRPTACT